jgi:cobalamin-dependent methionine synthase I
MILIGEDLNVMSGEFARVMKEQEQGPIQECVAQQTKNGMDYLDVNVGPVKKDPEGTMKWIINTVQEVTDLPLCLDTTNPVAMEVGLKFCQKKALINSASGATESMETMLPLAAKYSADVVLSVINDAGLPADADERAASIMESAAVANELGIPNEDIWVDAVLLPIGVDQRQVTAYLEFIPTIVSGFDQELIRLIRGEVPEIVALIYRAMDEEDMDISALPQKEIEYVKTAQVLMGKSLYSHSWLEV